VVCYYVVWYYDSFLNTLEFLAAELQPYGPGYQKEYPITPSINNNTKPLCFDIKPLCSAKFICGLIQKPPCFYMFYMVVWQLLWFVEYLENVV